MFQTADGIARRRAVRLTGYGTALAGMVAFIGLRALFLDNWIAITMFGLIGWISAAVYLAIATIATGMIFVIWSHLPTRKSPA